MLKGKQLCAKGNNYAAPDCYNSDSDLLVMTRIIRILMQGKQFSFIFCFQGCEYGDLHPRCHEFLHYEGFEQCDVFQEACCYTCGGHANKSLITTIPYSLPLSSTPALLPTTAAASTALLARTTGSPPLMVSLEPSSLMISDTRETTLPYDSSETTNSISTTSRDIDEASNLGLELPSSELQKAKTTEPSKNDFDDKEEKNSHKLPKTTSQTPIDRHGKMIEDTMVKTTIAPVRTTVKSLSKHPTASPEKITIMKNVEGQ